MKDLLPFLTNHVPRSRLSNQEQLLAIDETAELELCNPANLSALACAIVERATCQTEPRFTFRQIRRA